MARPVRSAFRRRRPRRTPPSRSPGRRPLMPHGHRSIERCRLLRAHGCDVRAAAGGGHTPVYMRVCPGSRPILLAPVNRAAAAPTITVASLVAGDRRVQHLATQEERPGRVGDDHGDRQLDPLAAMDRAGVRQPQTRTPRAAAGRRRHRRAATPGRLGAPADERSPISVACRAGATNIFRVRRHGHPRRARRRRSRRAGAAPSRSSARARAGCGRSSSACRRSAAARPAPVCRRGSASRAGPR